MTTFSSGQELGIRDGTRDPQSDQQPVHRRQNVKRSIGRVRRIVALVAIACAAPAGYAQSFSWETIANNGDLVPGTTALFNSYNQPAVNTSGLVVFRARGKVPSSGGEGEAVYSAAAAAAGMVTSGVFMRDMSAVPGPITTLAKRDDPVPAPNNILYNGLPASFTEFPSSPRIDATSPLAVTRGQSAPVYRYLLADGVTETRVGTAGVFANPGGTLVTGASLLGAVMEVQPDLSYSLTFPYYSVPDAPPGTRFDIFAGSSTAFDGTKIGFKGNFTNPADTLGYTGVYYRDLTVDGGKAPTTLIASSLTTLIPNQPSGGTVKFGATANPSASNGWIAFTGWDNEDAPTMGGVYRAPTTPSPALQTLAGIGDQVPGESPGATFRNFGEGLSMSENGRYVAFWGTWGAETTSKTMYCPTDGNADLLAYCNATYPDGFVVNTPVHQGIFVVDADTGTITPVAKTGENGFSTFMYWGFSGAPPGVGGGDEGGDADQEPPRWRAASFAALASKPGETYGAVPSPYQAAFKATRNGIDGIYMRQGDMSAPLATVVANFVSQGQAVDPEAPAGSIVTAVGIERDGFRNRNLAITVSMLYETVDTSIGWAGLYLSAVPAVVPVTTADVSIAKTAVRNPVTVGEDAAFTMTVTNNGPDTATGVTVMDAVPSGSAFVSASAACMNLAGTVTCNLGSLPSGASTQVEVVVRPAAAGSLSNTATVNAMESDPSSGNNTSSAAVTVMGIPTLSNLSTRSNVLTGDNVLIGGFVIGGTTHKTVVVRGIGPSLASFGVSNPLGNPTLQLFRSSDNAMIGTNDDWGSAANAAQISASGYAPSNPLESAILVTLAPGAYTAIVSGAGGGTGVGMFEVFELDHLESPLDNVSARGQVVDGDGVMIGGFVIDGGPHKVVVRVRGPSLAAFGIATPLGNPSLQIVRSSDHAVIAANDDWGTAANAAEISASGYAPSDSLESAVLMTLDPGAYTAIVSGAGGSSGVGIVEVFAIH